MKAGLHALSWSLRALTLAVLAAGVAVALAYSMLVFVIVAVQGVAGIGGH